MADVKLSPQALKQVEPRIRAAICKLARQGRLIDEAFKQFQRAVYPGAPPDQVHEMRTCFYAGAAELQALQFFAADTETNDATDGDLELWANIHNEIERFHQRTLKAAGAHPEDGRG